MKLSIMSYTFGRTGWFKQNAREGLKSLCRLARELSIEGIDWVTTHGIDPAEIRREMDDSGLKTVCHTFSAAGLNADSTAARVAAVDAVAAGIETAAVLGAPIVMLVTPGKPDIPRDISRRNYIHGLQECAVLARHAGVAMTIENFPGPATPFAISSDVLEAVRETPGLKLTYDNGNVMIGGEDPAVSFARCAPHVVHAHFKDWVSTDSDKFSHGLDGRFYKSALIGEGIVPHRACLAAMRKVSYTGFINIEYEANQYPPDEATRRAAAFLRDIIASLN